MSNVTDLIAAGDRLFGKRSNLLNHWQEVADNFCPHKADFTTMLQLGEDYAADLSTSYPLLVMRELAGTFGSLLRPTQKDAAVMYVDGMEDHDAKRWLEWATKIQRRAMHDRAAQYVIAAKDAEEDFTAFGQAVMTVERMPDRSSLLFRSWHLRDTVWADGLNGTAECVHRKWGQATAYDLAKLFGERKLHQKVRDQLSKQSGKDPYCEVNCRHAVIPTDRYEGEEKFRTPFVSVYVDVENEHQIEAMGVRTNPYVIPRWQRLKGSQYAISPAVVCALPEARLLQAMTLTLLTAGEKFVDPPLLATEGVLRDDLDVRAGGVNWVVADYDERTGDPLRPLKQDKSGMPLGLEMQQRSEMLLRMAFYADKLQMPPRGGPQETAYEVGQRVQQYIREALPLVEPVEIEFNGGVWERAFDVLLMDGAFGPPDEIPESLRGADVQFKFGSPLREQVDSQKGMVFLDGVKLLQAGAAIDPGVSNIPNAVEAMRSVLHGIGWEAKWMRSPEEVKAASDAEAEQAKAQAMLAAMGQAATVVKDLGGAAAPAATI